tara:strand:+ start:123640 stop:123822 length:183 start_codon:yes stop_codon:yes gene_type:complete
MILSRIIRNDYYLISGLIFIEKKINYFKTLNAFQPHFSLDLLKDKTALISNFLSFNMLFS